jgi:hypothetical protein
MKVTESPPDEERRSLFGAVANDGATLLKIDLEGDLSRSIMAKVNEAIVAMAFGESTPVSEDENPDLLLGCLWGEQMTRQFNWYWADVVIDDSLNEIALISPNQEMIIFPLSFVGACIQRHCICTVLLAFNMLLENDRIGEIEPGSYENIMLTIHHIVPPYTLETSG